MKHLLLFSLLFVVFVNGFIFNDSDGCDDDDFGGGLDLGGGSDSCEGDGQQIVLIGQAIGGGGGGDRRHHHRGHRHGGHRHGRGGGGRGGGGGEIVIGAERE